MWRVHVEVMIPSWAGVGKFAQQVANAIHSSITPSFLIMRKIVSQSERQGLSYASEAVLKACGLVVLSTLEQNTHIVKR
jgi:hypothetical protein